MTTDVGLLLNREMRFSDESLHKGPCDYWKTSAIIKQTVGKRTKRIR